MFFVWRLIISHIIRHCKFVLQGACTFLKNQRHVLFKLEQRTQRRKKLSSNRVFHKLDNNGWKMHTGARARKQKYICIHISLISIANCMLSNVHDLNSQRKSVVPNRKRWLADGLNKVRLTGSFKDGKTLKCTWFDAEDTSMGILHSSSW